MPLSNLQLEANRENAKLSTGPSTPAGKQRSSLNALRHGLTGQVVVLPEEDMKTYQLYSQDFAEDWHPRGATESHLVQTLADQQWRLHRAHSRERAAYAIGHDEYGGRINTQDPEIHAVLTSAVFDMERSKQLDQLSRHASRILRDYNSTLKQLISLQAARKEREAAELFRAGEIQKLHQMKKIEWKPATDGFVLSKAQVDTYLLRESHIEDAKIAATVKTDIQRYRAAGGN